MMKRIALCITLMIAATALSALPAYAQVSQTEIQKLLASDRADGDWFGHSVAIDGDTAVIGAPEEDDSGTTSNGAAYVFTRSAGTWTQQAKLLASDKASSDFFGYSVAIDGDTVVIGAYWERDTGTFANGAAYVFTRSADVWTQQAKLLASDKDSYDNFGRSVAIDSDTVVIGAKVDRENRGAVYVFTRSAGNWTEQVKLLESDKPSPNIYDYSFGESVAIDGDTAVIGAPSHNDSETRWGAGAAYVFTRSGGTWTEQVKLLASDKDSGDEFGISVALDGDAVVIGAPYSSDSGTRDNGAAYVFTRSAGTWTEQAKLLASDKNDSGNFGSSVAINGDTVVIGKPHWDSGARGGAAYVFTRSAGTWTQQAKLLASDRTDGGRFGFSVTIDGDTAAVGEPTDDDGGNTARGAAYVFDVSGLSGSSSPFIRALGDINGDGSQDIVVLANKNGTPTAKVKDAKDRHWIKTIRFDENLAAVDLEVMPDINGNGAPELAVLGSGGMRSEVRDSLTGKKLGYVDFDPNLAAIDLELVTDQTGNGVPELAMLGQTPIKVEVKDPINQRTVNAFKFNQNYVPKDLSVWPRSKAMAVGVLSESKDPTRGDKIEVRNLDTGQVIRNLWVGKPWNLLQMELVADLNGNGHPEAAILREHPDDQWVSVLPVDTNNGKRFRHLGFDPNYRPVRLRVLDDVNGNGYEEIAVLAVRRGCCNQKVWVKDAMTGQSIKRVFFGKQYIGVDMDISPDINGNGTPELVVLGQRDDGVLRAIIKDSKTGEFVSSVGF